jgi:hypothetical protein
LVTAADAEPDGNPNTINGSKSAITAPGASNAILDLRIFTLPQSAKSGASERGLFSVKLVPCQAVVHGHVPFVTASDQRHPAVPLTFIVTFGHIVTLGWASL